MCTTWIFPEDAVTYLHRAGRAGRIGSPVKGEALQTTYSTFNCSSLVCGVLMHELGAAHIALSAGFTESARIVGILERTRVLADRVECLMLSPYCSDWLCKVNGSSLLLSVLL